MLAQIKAVQAEQAAFVDPRETIAEEQRLKALAEGNNPVEVETNEPQAEVQAEVPTYEGNVIRDGSDTIEMIRALPTESPSRNVPIGDS